jgi:hypothetical protein
VNSPVRLCGASWRFFVIGRGNYISGERDMREKLGGPLAAEVREEPEDKGKGGTEDEAGDDGKIESGVFAAMDDVSGKFAEAKRESATEIEESA